MRIFLTGASGFIGSHIIAELIASGHQVLGLVRSEASAAKVAALGAEIHHGGIDDLDSLRAGAAACDAVIHTAFDHDFAHFADSCARDHKAILALGEALVGSDRPLLITSAVGVGKPGPGEKANEDMFDPNYPNPRIASELAGRELLDRGVKVLVMRLSQIHDRRSQGLITPLIDLAVEKGVVAYVGDGAVDWCACPVDDTARLYRLAIEKGVAGGRYHAVAEEAVSLRAIAETLAERLGLQAISIAPEDAARHFGWLAHFVTLNMPASSTLTRARLGWAPEGPGLLEDLAKLEGYA
ncbi:nucleoside-diphosphate-sugar epimerase [Rhizobium sp. SG_E_25_P2]|uniref:SDR family oxidoreductase n=1 Tax=Rhizobium sp. SG_E_25_P2 TaxID=2879942 RepID=UPI00247338C2|nr:SDR family oxidoreductase [Rhizobium sp. SG_E_25_P2]MDH6269901.1 nucleoside-diphosphate-sugar epimerase [Rhizobium sp. SG_E_25_P2]